MEFRILQSMDDIHASEWQSLVAPETSPFLEYPWLHACEHSGSMVPETGWQCSHLIGFRSSEDAEKCMKPILILPIYIKNHSWGEFVFDFAWADLASQLGKQYYPKAVGLIPATPVTAYRPLIAEGCGHAIEPAIHFLRAELEAAGVNSLSFLFVTSEFSRILESLGFNRWVHQGFRWFRNEQRSFDDYLAGFKKNQRKNIRKERRSVEENELRVVYNSGSDLSNAVAADMYALYSATNARFGMWAAKFFNEAFFKEIFRTFSENIIIISAVNGTAVGRSMLVCKNKKLFGRYWGAHRFVKNLHFNLCYYEPINFAIRSTFHSFDPGMGGEHKSRRGFMAIEQYSMHGFFDPLLEKFFAGNIHRFNTYARHQIDQLNGK